MESSEDKNISSDGMMEFSPHMFLVTPIIMTQLLLAVVGFVLNTVSVIATCHVPNGLTTHTRLIVNLGLSDALICACNVYIIMATAYQYRYTCLSLIIVLLGTTAHIASFLNLTAMALDHYVAILKPMDYYRLMKNRNGKIGIVIIWLISAIGGFSQCFTLVTYSDEDPDDNTARCLFVMFSRYNSAYLVFSATIICIIFMVVIYVRIVYEVRKIIMRSSDLTVYRQHKKAFFTTILIVGTFALLCLPRTFVPVIALVLPMDSNLGLVGPWLYILFLLNSVCDPFIYAFRLREVQKGYKRLYQRMCCCCRNRSDMGSMRRRSTMNTPVVSMEMNGKAFLAGADTFVTSMIEDNAPRKEENGKLVEADAPDDNGNAEFSYFL